MLEAAKTFDTRTIVLHEVEGDWQRAALALTHQTKNLYNTANHIIRQVVSAYDREEGEQAYSLKADLHPAQVDAIAHLNRCIAEVNRKREDGHPAKVAAAKAAGKKQPVLKVVPLLEATSDTPFRAALDVTVLDTALKAWRNEHGEIVYRRLPVAVAQQVIHRLVEAYKSFFKALRRFKADPTDMTGRPRMPGYLDRNGRFPLEVPFVNLKPSVPKPRSKTSVPENDFAPQPAFLTPAMLRAFYAHDMAGAIAQVCHKRGLRHAQPQHLRIVPLNKGVRVEAVVRVPNPYPEGSFLAGLVQDHEAELEALEDDRDREKWLLGHLGGLAADRLPRFATIDLGTGNLAAVAYSTGHSADVHTGGRFTATMGEFTRLIGERVSAITPSRADELQAKKLALRKQDKNLPRHEDIELRTLLKAVYEDGEYRRLTGKKQRWSEDFLHKLSTHIVRECVHRRIGVIVIGRNKGWKQGVNMGREQNRVFCEVAHRTLIRLISYKAESHGIAVATTEESYTSKTSFVNNDQLECYADKVSRSNSQGEARDVQATSTPVLRTGRRSSADRNWFRNWNRNDRWEWVHADVNGALNIARKVFKSFAFHAGLTLKFNLLRLSPRFGITRLAPAAAGA